MIPSEATVDDALAHTLAALESRGSRFPKPSGCARPRPGVRVAKDGGYLLPIKNAVRKPRGLLASDDVTVETTARLHG